MRVYIFYIALRLETQTVTPTLLGYQGLKKCIQYLASRPHKPILIPIVNSMNQMPSELHGVEIRLKATQPK